MTNNSSHPKYEAIWSEWTEQHIDQSDPIPLFETESDLVATKIHGQDDRHILKRSQEMESLLIQEVNKVIVDWTNSDDSYDGVISMMYVIDDGTIIPRYIAKAGKYGRDGESLSANLSNIESSTSKFARWGDGGAYHIGKLSKALLGHHADPNVRSDASAPASYQEWASELFIDGTRTLREPVYFWAKAWRPDKAGPIDSSPADLDSVKAQLIKVASALFPEYLLNR